ncbi:putative glycolipid permease LtaA [Paenibacillus baekrokdamisoli]|uniref:Putative glycolipid permease LtaA n=1 Tax=Paenibacillus baekrokdamisoli TaxID=1712516 RepID=A0A3G9IWT2_9BACL|nr:MFS transporter [Paenibacillus baekrokdamisoli]MBB3068205.1 MFS family permease [Paenibacillus baekrokdamisoli]BBH22752.1 putative glycolipid permease LtaA [Paenibacillus baekrokdamisoli]
MIVIRKRWFDPEITLFSVILFIVEFVRGAVLISFLPIFGEKSLGLSLNIIGVAITAHYLTDTLLKMAIGYLLDRFSIRFVVHIGLLISLIGIIMFQFSYQPWVFILAAALYGVGISPIWIVCLTKVSEEHRATQMGFLYTVWFIGIGSGPIVSNILLDISKSFTYYLLLSFSILSWVLALFISNRKVSETVSLPIRQQFSILIERLRHMKLLLPGMVLQTMGAGMLIPILPSFAEERLGLNGKEYSLLLLAGGALTVLGLIPLGRLSDKLGGKKWFLVLGFCCIGGGLYFLGLEPPLWQCILLTGALGLSYAALLPAWNALLANYVPPMQQGLGWGIFSTVEGIGGMIGPVIGGTLAAWQGQTSVVWYSAILYGLIGFFYIWFPFRAFTDSGSIVK